MLSAPEQNECHCHILSEWTRLYLEYGKISQMSFELAKRALFTNLFIKYNRAHAQ